MRTIFQRLTQCSVMIGGFSKTMTQNIRVVLLKEFIRNDVPEVMDWPSNSPNLNPIENLWAIVKGNVERRMPKNLAELKRFMDEEWRAIPDTVLTNLVGSMKRRCELIIENNGERISF